MVQQVHLRQNLPSKYRRKMTSVVITDASDSAFATDAATTVALSTLGENDATSVHKQMSQWSFKRYSTVSVMIMTVNDLRVASIMMRHGHDALLEG